jgi:two-component system, NtrC family, response regulator AtoC
MRALVADDDADLAELVARWLRHLNVNVETAPGGRAALAAFDAQPFDLVLTDLMMPDMGGRPLLEAIKQRDPLVPVVVMSAVDSPETASSLLRLGADDYLVKPFRQAGLVARLKAIIEKAQRLSDARVVREGGGGADAAADNPHGIVGRSPVMRQILSRVRLFARTDAPVLILGESGTGKELVARAIHRESSRVAGPFVAVNCGAIPVTLFESQFFGHRKGAFSDATRDHKGFVAEAEGGTLFLDEVGELPLSVQAALLRTLQEKEYRPLGDTQSHRANVRICAATNRGLSDLVREGRFRSDLFYRLNVLTVDLPPLRERAEDIEPIAQQFITALNREWGTQVAGFDPLALAMLRRYPWPGNVRELQNVVQRSVAVTEGPVVGPAALPDGIRGEGLTSAQMDALTSPTVVFVEGAAATKKPDAGEGSASGLPSLSTGLGEPGKLNDVTVVSLDQAPPIPLGEPFQTAKQGLIEQFERAYILGQLDANGGNISAAARASGMDRKSYWRLLQKYRV